MSDHVFEEAIFPLPSGSGTCEIEILSNGTDTNGFIQLVMEAGGDVECRFDSQAFGTVSSIFEKKERFTMNGDEERTPFRLHPALSGFTAEWKVCCEDSGTPRLFTAKTGGTAAKTIADAFDVWASSGWADDNFDIEASLAGNYATETATLKAFSMLFEPITSEWKSAYPARGACEVRARAGSPPGPAAGEPHTPDGRAAGGA